MSNLSVYRPNTPPGTNPAIVQELRRIEASLRDLADYAPQPAIREPSKRRDGMVRLARSPWRPVDGQTADAWVYFDGTDNEWKYLAV